MQVIMNNQELCGTVSQVRVSPLITGQDPRVLVVVKISNYQGVLVWQDWKPENGGTPVLLRKRVGGGYHEHLVGTVVEDGGYKYPFDKDDRYANRLARNKEMLAQLRHRISNENRGHREPAPDFWQYSNTLDNKRSLLLQAIESQKLVLPLVEACKRLELMELIQFGTKRSRAQSKIVELLDEWDNPTKVRIENVFLITTTISRKAIVVPLRGKNHIFKW